jgi:hypothetical protein
MPRTIEEQVGLIDRYLNNKLDDSERAAFEVMLLEDEQLFARVQLLDAFKNSLVEERAALQVARASIALPFRAWLQQPLSLAAAVLVAGLGLRVAYEEFSARGDAQVAAGIGAVFIVEATRGASQPVLSGEPPYLFQIDAGPNAANSTVAVVLRDAAGEELLHVENLPVDSSGWARVVFEQELAGAYTLELTAAGAKVRSFPVTISD